MNLRKDTLTKYEILTKIFDERKANVLTRKELEVKIKEQNSKLVQQLQLYLNPIAKKTNVGFHISIQDTKVELSTVMFIIGKRHTEKARVSLDMLEIKLWFTNPEVLKEFILKVEKSIRNIKALTKTGRDKGTILLTNPDSITIGIDTKDRYF